MKLVGNDFVLIVQPKLALTFGLNVAMFLQQLHYWITKCGVEREGENWIYNTYADWHEQYPFLSERTIMRTVKKLEDFGMLVKANYNRFCFDKVVWFRINHPWYSYILKKFLVYLSQTKKLFVYCCKEVPDD